MRGPGNFGSIQSQLQLLEARSSCREHTLSPTPPDPVPTWSGSPGAVSDKTHRHLDFNSSVFFSSRLQRKHSELRDRIDAKNTEEAQETEQPACWTFGNKNRYQEKQWGRVVKSIKET